MLVRLAGAGALPGASHTGGGGVDWHNHFENGQYLFKPNVRPPYDPAVPSPGICLKEMCTNSHHSPFPSALFIIAPLTLTPPASSEDWWGMGLVVNHDLFTRKTRATRGYEVAHAQMASPTGTVREAEADTKYTCCVIPFI